jgi:DNA-binding beta-propeller fold protein YncE
LRIEQNRFARPLIAFAAVVAIASAGAGAVLAHRQSPPLKPVGTVGLPGPSNRFDYMSLDPRSNRLFIAHMNAGQLLFFDLGRRRVTRTIAAPGVHGVISVPKLHRLYATATDARQLFTIDSRTGKVLARASAGRYPDGLAYDPRERRVFVSDEVGGVDAVFNAAGHRIATVDLGGAAGNTQYDANSGHVLVAVQTRNDVVVINPSSSRIIRRVALAGCDHPHGLYIDSPRRLAFIACDGNAKLLALDLTTMKVIGHASVGSSPDVLAFDTTTRWLYVAAESGDVAVFAEQGRKLRKLGQWALAPTAHTVAVDPRTHYSYFPIETGAHGKPELRIMAPN